MGTETKLATVATQLTTASSSGAVTRATMNSRFVKNDSSSFPAGLRVLVVDDDPTCLLILETMLRKCLYKVTKCTKAIEALKTLREKKDGFDLVISDVYMPDMDGFKLLELVGLEMDLPVIMMSADGETSAVMKGIKHGACDYLLKPVRREELKNIWQHVVRRKKAGNIEDRQRLDEYTEYHTPASEGPDVGSKHSKRRSDIKEEEEDADLDNEDPSTSKKPRVVWSVELHQQFVSAVNQLGIDKAVPKRILELMNVKGLTRENVASHLQKYRLYLKRISGVAHQTGGLGSMFAGSSESTSGVVGGELGDLCALARAQLSPQVLASTLHLGRLGPNNGIGMDPSLLLKLAAMQGINSSALVRPSYGPPLINTSGGAHLPFSSELDLKHLSSAPQQMASFSQLDRGPAGFSNLEQLSVAASLGGVGQLVGLDNHLPANTSNNSPMMQILKQQTGSHMVSKAALSTSTGGQQILPGGLGARIQHVSSFDLGIDAHLMSGQECSMPGPNFTPFDALASLRTGAMDNNNLHLSHAGHVDNSLPSNASLPSCHGIDGEIIAPSNNGFLPNAGEALVQGVQGPVGNSLNSSGGNPGSRLNMGLSNWQNWQSFELNEELGQTTSRVLNPYHNQGPSSGQALQGSRWAPEHQGGVAVDVSNFKTLTTTAPSYTEHNAGETQLKFKEGSFELLVDMKTENGMASEPFSSSDDLFNSYFKQQQQEVMGFSEGDMAAEGYTLGNMYVK